MGPFYPNTNRFSHPHDALQYVALGHIGNPGAERSGVTVAELSLVVHEAIRRHNPVVA